MQGYNKDAKPRTEYDQPVNVALAPFITSIGEVVRLQLKAKLCFSWQSGIYSL